VDGHQVIRLASGLREPPLQKLIEGLQLLEAPVLPGPDFAQISAKLHKPGVFLSFLALLPGEDLISIFESTNSARRGFSLGSIGGFLVIKFVKPTKVFCSWPPDQRGRGYFGLPQAQST